MMSEDYYLNENGYVVFTASFLEKRGLCCGNGCKHCPFDYENVPNSLEKKHLQASRLVEANGLHRADSSNHKAGNQ